MIQDVKICNWSVVYASGDGYDPPEIRGSALDGEVYGHPSFPDGSHITSSRIIDAAGCRIRTKNRMYMIVGPPSVGYQKYCQENGIQIDPENPVKRAK